MVKSFIKTSFALVLIAASAPLTAQSPSPTPTKASTMEPQAVPGSDHHEFNTKVPMVFAGEMLEIPYSDGKKVAVYASGAKDAERQIFLIHEWWGLNAHIKGLADQFALLGYRAYAIDLYDGKAATKPEEAQKYMKEASADPDAARLKITAALGALANENPKAKRATIGWCFGGGWSLQTAIDNPRLVDACVIYYGQMETDEKRLAEIDAPVLGIFADKDAWLTPKLVQEFEDRMKKLNKVIQTHHYPADHAFANPSGNRFQEKEAADAWKTTLAFLDSNLRRPDSPHEQ